MAAQAIALLEDERAELARWGVAAAIVLTAHAGLLATYLMLRSVHSPGPPNVPAVIIDLAPMPVAPESPMDVAPAPEVLEQLPPPEPQVVEQEKVEPVVVEPVPVEHPLVVLPVEKPQPEVKPEPAPEVKPEEKPVPEVRKKSMTQAAPPKTERVASTAAAPRLGTNARTNSVNWEAMLMAHLNRHKQYPSAARARREQGTVTVSFTVDRNGRVLSRRIVRSSGSAALDQEALAMLSRAQPLPAFPADMEGSSRSFNAPIRFSMR